MFKNRNFFLILTNGEMEKLKLNKSLTFLMHRVYFI